MDHGHYSRKFKSDADYGPGWRQTRRDTINEDLVPDDVSLPAPPTRSPVRSEAALGAHGYAGQGYPIYGRRSSERHDRLDPTIVGPASSAYAFGYTTSVRSSPPHQSSLGRASSGHAGQGPRDVRVDARVLEDVCDRLSDDDEIDARDISVSISRGEVTLSGTVSDRYIKRRAEHIAASVRGVTDVHNRLRTRKGLLRELGDTIVGESAEEHHGHRGSGTRAPHHPH
jgi:hypothetical protein